MKIARAVIDSQLVFGELEDERFHVLRGDVFEAPVRTGDLYPLEELRLLSPVDAHRIFLMLGGFLPGAGASVAEGEVPRLAMKTVSSVSGDGGNVVVPSFVTTPVWIEVELAAVIGRTVRAADPDEAAEAIFGFTCFNDVSAPQFIYDLDSGESVERPDYFRSKSIETFASMGPCVRTDLSDAEIADGLRLTAHVNGELLAEGNTRLFKFAPSEVVSYISQLTTLRRGDVIALGTPQPALAAAGDEIELAVEGIGSFRNRISSALD